MRALGPASRSARLFDEVGGDVGGLDVLVLRGRGEQGEGSIGGDPVAFHQDALGLPDEVPAEGTAARICSARSASARVSAAKVANIVVIASSSRPVKADGSAAYRLAYQAPLVRPQRNAQLAEDGPAGRGRRACNPARSDPSFARTNGVVRPSARDGWSRNRCPWPDRTSNDVVAAWMNEVDRVG